MTGGKTIIEEENNRLGVDHKVEDEDKEVTHLTLHHILLNHRNQ